MNITILLAMRNGLCASIQNSAWSTFIVYYSNCFGGFSLTKPELRIEFHFCTLSTAVSLLTDVNLLWWLTMLESQCFYQESRSTLSFSFTSAGFTESKPKIKRVYWTIFPPSVSCFSTHNYRQFNWFSKRFPTF